MADNTYNPHCGPIVQQPTTFPTDRPIFYNQKLEPVVQVQVPQNKLAQNADTMRT